MKPFIIGTAAFLFCIMFYSFQHDYNINRHYFMDLKVVCEEASVDGALFVDNREYANGRVVFNQTEGRKAIEATIKAMLYLDNSFYPTANSYWTDRVTYKAYFFDDGNTAYPKLFIDPDTGFTYLVKSPCVVVTIDAGNAAYRLSFLRQNRMDNIRSAAHVWEGR